MPRQRKRKNQRKRRVPRPLTSMGTPSGMQVARRANLRYSSPLTLASTLGVLNSVVYRANSPFDPLAVTGDHSAYGFDQWALLYNHYVVVGAKMTLSAVTFDTQAIMLGCHLADDASTSYNKYIDFNMARKGNQAVIVKNTKPTKITSNFSAKKFFNITDIKDNFDRLGASTSVVPTELAEFHVYAQTFDLVNSSTVDMIVQIDYIVEFSEPKDILISS